MFGLITKKRHEYEMQKAVDRATDAAYQLGKQLSQIQIRQGTELYWNQIEAIYNTNVANKGELEEDDG